LARPPAVDRTLRLGRLQKLERYGLAQQVELFAASIGVWLFYVQYQFEDTFWAPDKTLSLHEAALHGSSHYDLPAVLRWFTANIGVQHVHHLCNRYRLSQVLRDCPELDAVGRLTLTKSLGCVRLVL
jgi:omega-6 fatty acid desaturase (delta-12 desaturase)